MKSTFENNILTIYPEGTLDTNNADQFGEEVAKIRETYPDGQLVLDLDDLTYISSAGLRQILKLKKREADFKIINCSSEIYDIFEMTGFAEMMDISKAFRKMSVEGCEIIGEGSNGVVYRLNPDTIIKVYKNSDALDAIKRERELARTALVLGINTAIPFDVVRVGDKYGSVFEMLSAKSLTKLIVAEPENREKYIKVFSDMLKEIHETSVKPGLLPSAKEETLERIKYLEGHIPTETYTKLLSMVEAIPESFKMIHGDYHTNNVHYANGEAILIDMDTLSAGNPIFEFASIFLAYRGFGELDQKEVTNFLKIDWENAGYILNQLMHDYFEGKDAAYKEEVMNKAKVLGYARVLRRTIKRTPDQTEKIEHYKKQLIEYTAKVDSLAI